jgi:hypothetical protein
MQEVWKNIPGYEGIYQVSNIGNVKSFKRYDGKLLTPQIRSGYYSVKLYFNLQYKHVKVHQLVAMAFLGYVRNGLQDIVVDHINDNKLDNQLENLQLITQRYNASKSRVNNSGLTGVYKNKYNNFRAQIKINSKQIHLGYFKTKEEAHLAYQNKLKEVENGK